MFPDENEIRRGVSRRPVRSGAQAWPEIARRLQPAAPVRRGRLSFAAASLLLLLAASLWLRPAPPRPTLRSAPRGFLVNRVESRGRPAAAVVLQPDRDTLLVIVPE
ncbi:MAG TPA: hypothetical protein VKG01_17650 [Thermoanaerobaculia bacterium]|nr:hypothetical protein [Thermoanaerobaculia bacterium]